MSNKEVLGKLTEICPWTTFTRKLEMLNKFQELYDEIKYNVASTPKL